MFFGKYDLQLSNNQFTLPPGLRDSIGASFFITQGFDRNLYLLSQEAFNTVCSHLKATSISDPLARLMSRLFLGSAVQIELGSLGNIELPSSLCAYADLDEELVLIGQGDYIEIWSPKLWQEQLAILNDHEENSHRFEKFLVSLV